MCNPYMFYIPVYANPGMSYYQPVSMPMSQMAQYYPEEPLMQFAGIPQPTVSPPQSQPMPA